MKNIQVVLVRAENPANIGQTARAMKNFGLSRLVLVRCAPHQVQEAYSLGWNAKEILDGAAVFTNVGAALSNSVLSVVFPRRSGHARGEPRPFSFWLRASSGLLGDSRSENPARACP